MMALIEKRGSRMTFENILTQKQFRWPRKGELPFQKSSRDEAAGPLAADGITRTVLIIDGFMHGGALKTIR
jgi:hypothetical protein